MRIALELTSTIVSAESQVSNFHDGVYRVVVQNGSTVLLYTSLFAKDGSINRKEKYTHKQRYTINKNENRNIEIE